MPASDLVRTLGLRRLYILASVVALLMLLSTSCGALPELPPGESSMVGRDVERLGEWIELPATPTSVAWHVRRSSHPSVKPSQYSLTAVLSFEKADADEIMSKSPLLEPERSVFVDEIPDWFPEEARREMVRTGDGPAEGYYFGEGNLSHASDEFDSTKFRGGHAVRVGDSDMIYINILSD